MFPCGGLFERGIKMRKFVSLLIAAGTAAISTYAIRHTLKLYKSTIMNKGEDLTSTQPQANPIAIIHIWGDKEEISEDELDNIAAASTITIANSFPHTIHNETFPEGIESSVVEGVIEFLGLRK